MADAVRIEGLTAFRRDLRRIDPALAKGITRSLKAAADIVAEEARREIEEKGLVRSGRMLGSVRSFTSGNRAGVRVNARRVSAKYPSGYPYPRRYEFGDRARPFLAPALERKRAEVARRMEHALDDVADIWEG